MDEKIDQDSEWSQVMHPADAMALERLRMDDTLSTLKLIGLAGLTLATAAALSLFLLL